MTLVDKGKKYTKIISCERSLVPLINRYHSTFHSIFFLKRLGGLFYTISHILDFSDHFLV